MNESGNDMPESNLLKGYYRHDIAKLLTGEDNLGVELGIAEGVFSERMLQSKKFKHYIGIDMYADGHDIGQYKRALSRQNIFNPNYRILRMKFDEAMDLFEDNSLDFIYVDGYAHSGEEGGLTFKQWYPKLKVGGVFAGDDYDPAWPLVKLAVDSFVKQTQETLYVTELSEPTDFSEYPTWAVVKSKEVKITIEPKLVKASEKAKSEHLQLHRRRLLKEYIIPDNLRRFVRKLKRSM